MLCNLYTADTVTSVWIRNNLNEIFSFSVHLYLQGTINQVNWYGHIAWLLGVEDKDSSTNIFDTVILNVIFFI